MCSSALLNTEGSTNETVLLNKVPDVSQVTTYDMEMYNTQSNMVSNKSLNTAFPASESEKGKSKLNWIILYIYIILEYMKSYLTSLQSANNRRTFSTGVTLMDRPQLFVFTVIYIHLQMTQMNTMGFQRQRSSHRSQGDYSAVSDYGCNISIFSASFDIS